nr:hypothetical protein CFP56_11092 [Quercus suber]
MFKIPREEDIDIVLNEYEILRKNAMKDGRPYIVSNVARRILNTSSSLSEGFTLASQSIFKNKADHDFYDQICPAHKELKVLPELLPSEDEGRCDQADLSSHRKPQAKYVRAS